MSSYQELDIVVDRADHRPAAISILAAIRPQWKAEEICITVSTIMLQCVYSIRVGL